MELTAAWEMWPTRACCRLLNRSNAICSQHLAPRPASKLTIRHFPGNMPIIRRQNPLSTDAANPRSNCGPVIRRGFPRVWRCVRATTTTTLCGFLYRRKVSLRRMPRIHHRTKIVSQELPREEEVCRSKIQGMVGDDVYEC